MESNDNGDTDGQVGGSGPVTQEDPTEQQTTENESTPEPVAEAQVLNSTLNVVEGEYRNRAFAEGEIENTGNQTLLILNALARFLDSDGRLISTTAGQAMGVRTGEVWAPKLRYAGSNLSDIESIELRVQDTEGATDRTIFSGDGGVLNVESSEVQVPQDETALPRFVANIKNVSGSTIARARFIGKVFDSDERLLSTCTAVVSGFEPGEIWNVDRAAMTQPRRASQIAQHEALFFILPSNIGER